MHFISSVKGHAEVSQGQPEVNMLRNMLYGYHIVRRIPDPSIVYCCDERLCGVMLGQPDVNLLTLPYI